MNDDEYKEMAKKHGLSPSEIRRLRNQAQTPWLGASIAHLKFEVLLKEAKLKKANKANGAKKMRLESPDTVSDENSVKIFGSSLVGHAFGIDAFREADKFLTHLFGKGRLECRTPWCRACTLYKLQLSDGVVGHVMKISFPNIIKLTEMMKFSWSWERSDSEWAKSHGKASDDFQRLVSIKSKPVWHITIQSEENIMRLLGAPVKVKSAQVAEEKKPSSQDSMRYFAKLGAENKAINIYRFMPVENSIIEDYWSPQGWKHDQDAEIVGYLALGEGDFTEISEEVARKIFPKAFDK